MTQIGSVLPLLSSSTGLVFDSFLAEGETALLRKQETPHLGAGQLREIERHIEQIRSTGVHQIQGMLMPGINAASSPLFAVGNKLVGVITVVGPGSVLTDEAQTLAARRLLETAVAISERMGGSRPAGYQKTS
nr:IclR family transcriptional regulator C-terminal domain-containing protein [Pseudomonas cannabina]